MDIVLVSISLVDAVLSLTAIGKGKGQGENRSSELDMLSVMRTLRVARVVRVLKVLTFCKKLWLLTVGVMDAMRALVWAPRRPSGGISGTGVVPSARRSFCIGRPQSQVFRAAPPPIPPLLLER